MPQKKAIDYDIKVIAKLSDYRLKQIWNAKFSDKTMPRIDAFIVEDIEFERFHKQLLLSGCKDTTAKEWGVILKSHQVAAFLCHGVDSLIICVRQHSTDIDGDLEHELRHIYLGEHETI